MREAGNAHMGVGRASGKDKARLAAENAISSPLLETSINGAKGVIVNFTTSPEIGLDEVAAASDMISAAAHPDVNLIWGVAFDENLQDEMIITVIATGFESDDPFTIPSYTFKSAPGKEQKTERTPAMAAASTGAAAATAPPPPPSTESSAARAKNILTGGTRTEAAPAAEEEDDDDTDPFIQILEMFKKK
ncbi:MAG: cell division protein FtsZ, partial [Oscillospiraceae bacterium]